VQSDYGDCMHADAHRRQLDGRERTCRRTTRSHTRSRTPRWSSTSASAPCGRLVHAGAIESILIGRSRRISRAALVSYIEGLPERAA
jgi:hypothetical protein